MATHMRAQANVTDHPHVEQEISSGCDNGSVEFVGHENHLVSDDVRLIFQILNFVVIIQIINLFGTGTNIINIMCFVKQGMKDPVSVALLGLAVSDLVSMATLIWLNVCRNPLFYHSNIPFHAKSIALMTTGIPHVAFTRVTCCITAFISLERCLCVVLPLKVQLIFSAKRVTIIVISIYIVILTANIVPFYYTTRFAMLPHPHTPNATWLGIGFTEDKSTVEKYSFAINMCFIPFSTFTIISVSTVIMTDALRRKAKWRKISAAPGSSDSVSSRDVSLSKMIVIISTMFVICYTPVCLIFIGMLIVPEFSILGRYQNLNSILVSVSDFLESGNASFNIFIYYNMSSRYRQTFRKAVCVLRVRDRNNTFRKLKKDG